MNQRRKAAEDKLAQIERETKATQQAQEATYDFDAKEKEYLDLVLDGKTEEAIALRKEIRAAERTEFQRVATEQAQTVSKQATVQERIQEITARYESDYDVFDPESEHWAASSAAESVALEHDPVAGPGYRAAQECFGFEGAEAYECTRQVAERRCGNGAYEYTGDRLYVKVENGERTVMLYHNFDCKG